RAYNFSAGPAILPEPVIQQAQKDLWNFGDSGMGVCELSHRGKHFDRILEEAEATCREVGRIPDNYRVLFLQGGATTQTAMIPMSFLPEGRTADYFHTGKWATEAIAEARKLGRVHVCASTEKSIFDHIPADHEIKYSEGAAYCHYVTNNTIYGTQWHNRYPQTKAPLIGDMSSDMYSRPIDWSKYSMVYASAQKNLGPSGQILAVIRDDFLATAPEGKLPVMLDYQVQAKKQSRFNTPNTFAIYLMGEIFKWILKEFGTLEEVDRYNTEKAELIYNYLDGTDFYVGHASPESRSLMNVSFRCRTPELDAMFIKLAAEQNLVTIKGHRSTGGMRASIYNAFPRAGCEALVRFMKEFEMENM
ncbi:MAG: 3-phosphoserine/phosphohydroxythreonine transaminase, partial [Phycisphaerales bacterium]|nr:3-phosphoserine/phosphohydroxythreonine transaminase [Phycisphaerales bacterium]